jgi:DNA-directed RNA polymerase subunit RPC12/RpoP
MSEPQPPAAPPATTAPVPSQTLAYACDGCGARVEYVPGTASLRCPYCRHEQAVTAPARAIREHSFAGLATKARSVVGTHVLCCAKCGASSNSDDLAKACQFCGSPLVATADADEQIPPEAVLPFGVDRNGVRAALRSWVRSRRFAPRTFRSVSEAESLVGTYMPHWTYDAETASDYWGERGDHYWETETYTENVNGQQVTQTRQVQRTNWYAVSGRVERSFDDVVVRGTGRVADAHQDKLEPWPLGDAVAYQPEYLAGYAALRYDVEPEDGLDVAKQQMAAVIDRDCRADIGGDEQRVRSVDTQYADITYKLLLLPVWVVCYLYAGRTWQVLVNGRTAEVIGDRPYSKWKIAGAVLFVLAMIAAIITLVALHHHH